MMTSSMLRRPRSSSPALSYSLPPFKMATQMMQCAPEACIFTFSVRWWDVDRQGIGGELHALSMCMCICSFCSSFFAIPAVAHQCMFHMV